MYVTENYIHNYQLQLRSTMSMLYTMLNITKDLLVI